MTGKHAGNTVYKTHKRVGRSSATTLDGCFPASKDHDDGGQGAEQEPAASHEEPFAADHTSGTPAPGHGLERQVCGGLPGTL